MRIAEIPFVDLMQWRTFASMCHFPEVLIEKFQSSAALSFRLLMSVK